MDLESEVHGKTMHSVNVYRIRRCPQHSIVLILPMQTMRLPQTRYNAGWAWQL